MPPGGLYISATSMRFRGGINVSLARRLVRKSSLIAQKAINTRNFDSAPGHQYFININVLQDNMALPPNLPAIKFSF